MSKHIIIVGGGFTGTALAIHLARLGPAELRVTVVEPRPQLAQGVAYSTTDPAHRINVPAARMQLAGDENGVFDSWFRASEGFKADDNALWSDGNVYPQRSQFGRWVNEQFIKEKQRSAVILRHLRDRAIALHDGRVTTASGQTYQADKVVLAISHPPPVLPDSLKMLHRHPGLIVDPWQADALASVNTHDRVAIVGSGLTMSDVIASLHRLGHRGNITAFSRRGQLPRPNLSGTFDERRLDYQQPQQASVRAWLRRIRQEVARAAEEDLPWQLVLDDIRRQGQVIWQTLPLDEQRRFLRHLRTWWDVHRYRIAPQVNTVLNKLQCNGQLKVIAARLQTACASDTAIRLTLQARGAASENLDVERVIVTTGPAHSRLLNSDALLHQLASDGVIQADPLALGIHVNTRSQTLNAEGKANLHLYVAGPAARGRYGELMGLPQVAEHAEFVARQLLDNSSPLLKERCPFSLTD